ncbi:MAG: AraC family transcriptional regulator [Nocardioides sp.]|nr:AraC family transcriptional regulator [Nocardioides sp.]
MGMATVNEHEREPGVPYTAFAQLLEGGAISADAAARFQAIMAREVADGDVLLRPDWQAPARWFREVYPELDIDQATRLGRTFAEQAQLTSFGPLSLPLISAGSVAEIVELLTFLPLITTAVATRIRPQEDGLAVGLTGHTGDPELDCLIVTYCGSALVRLINVLVGDTLSMTLHCGWPAPAAEHQYLPGPDPRFAYDAPTTYLHVPAETLADVCRFSDPTAYRLAIADLQKALDQRMRTSSFSEKVRISLDDGPGSKSGRTVAAEFSLSVSTLKRRLRDEGTTFGDLLRASKLERAKLQLLDPSVSISQVAADLGYSDLANFSHAFKRWTGQPPSQFRPGRNR